VTVYAMASCVADWTRAIQYAEECGNRSWLRKTRWMVVHAMFGTRHAKAPDYGPFRAHSHLTVPDDVDGREYESGFDGHVKDANG